MLVLLLPLPFLVFFPYTVSGSVDPVPAPDVVSDGSVDPVVSVRGPGGQFEDHVRKFSLGAEDRKRRRRDGRLGADIRVARALGEKGYTKVRISVVGDADLVADDFLAKVGGKWDYKAAFRYRWRAAYDLGTKNVRCGGEGEVGLAGSLKMK